MTNDKTDDETMYAHTVTQNAEATSELKIYSHAINEIAVSTYNEINFNIYL